VTEDRVAAALSASPLFGGLDPAVLERLAGSCRRRSYADGELVFLQGDPGGSLHVLLSGAVGISVRTAEGGQAVLAVLRPPESFGELAVLDGGPRVATATARGPSTTVQVPRPQVQALVDEHAAFGAALLAALVRMVRRADLQVTDRTLLALPQRVEKFLLAELQRTRPGVRGAPGQMLATDLTVDQTDVAQRVGGSRQHVNRILGELEAAGALTRHGRHITGLRPDLLGGPPN
jgi:CRP/FNR family cyclic AMP-dependent transcriptional regulator